MQQPEISIHPLIGRLRLLKEEMMILTEILRGKIKIPGVFLRVSI